MIKSITTIRHAGSVKEFKALGKLFDALGFERGAPWKTARGQGVSFNAPVGKLEFAEGLEAVHSDIWVQVTDLDSVRDVLMKEKVKIASDIEPTTWNSRFLVAEPGERLKILFWQKDRPEEDAVEGGLNAQGMSFAIVVSRWNSFIT